MTSTAVETGTIKTKIPSRLDRLPWARFHWLIVLGLGTAWILDGLEVTIVGTVATRMTQHGSGISISVSQIGTAGAVYVAGACLGALFFGQLTDRFGRKKLFLWTLGLYLVATAATAGSFNFWYFFIARFFTGAGIGGEYAAINSAIDELIPARARGRVDLIINGSFWVGSVAGSAASIALLNTAWLPVNVGWRIGFVLGVILAIAVMMVRRHVPESPRWLFIHGREQEAEAIVGSIERGIEQETGQPLRTVSKVLTVRQRKTIPFREIARVGFRSYPKRSVLALALFVGQAFIYNGITFNLGTLMSTFFKVSSSAVPIFLILYGAANFLGPLTIGRLFDTVGRRPMISLTYLGSAALGVALAILFSGGALNSWTFIGFVMATFFLASAGASAAYLTASEIFPMETRALAIAFFYAIGTAVGGVTGPLLFGNLIGSGKAGNVAVAFLIGSGVMAVGGIAEIIFGIPAEQQQLEDIAKPLTVADAERAEQAGPGGGPAGAQQAGPGGGVAAAEAGRLPAAEARRAHAEAAQQRANAAEHLAAMHSQLARARAGDEPALGRADDERVLAEVAELTAQAYDQDAVAAEEDERAATAAGQDETAATTAQHRAAAARERARALRTQADALAAESPPDAERARELAEAGHARALAEEQRAEAVLAPAGTDNEELGHAIRRMHEAWAQAHEARARVSDLRAGGGQTAEAERRAEAAVEDARAAEESVRAAELREDARQEYAAEEAEQESAREAARQRAQQQQEARREEQIRARLQRRRRQEQGLRRLRPGPGRSVAGSPAISTMAPAAPELLDHEIATIDRVLRERGPLSRAEIRELAGARYWGPGVFRRALAEAVADGVVRRVGRETYAAADSAGEPGTGPPAESAAAASHQGQ